MSNAYVMGVDAIGGTAASRDLNALLNATPMSAAEGQRLVDLSLALVGEPGDARSAELARMLSNMGESIKSRWVDPLPEQAADLLQQTVRDALHLGERVVGARTKQTRTTLGPRGRVLGDDDELLGDVSGWDNTQAYNSGSYTYYGNRYWRALRDVTPPFWPTVQSGDAPGSSDAWREVTAGEAYGNKNVLGEDDWAEILGDAVGTAVNITDWDSGAPYAAGDVVRYWGGYYKANRAIDAGSIFWGNAAPDKGDAWTEVAASTVIYGDDPFEVLGMFDIGEAQLRMNSLPKQVPVSVALPLLKHGQDVINQAIAIANAKNLPGGTDRNNVMWKLKWHEGALGALASTPNAIYQSSADLEHWAMQAFIESNAVEEGAAWVDGAWSRMWDEIGAALAALPKQIVQTLAKLPGQVFEATTGIPSWAFYVGGAALVGLLGYGTYRILRGPAGGAIVSHYLGRR